MALTLHFKEKHGSPQQTADMLLKKIELRKFLADKERRGVCNATKSCENPAKEGSFKCHNHHQSVNILNQTLLQKQEAGTLSGSSISHPDEFSLLLQRLNLSLDAEARSSLEMLVQGLDNVQGPYEAFVIDTEFIWVGQHIPLDITIMRLKDGKEILSTRVDHGISVKDLEAQCLNSVSRLCVRKVYGRADKT